MFTRDGLAVASPVVRAISRSTGGPANLPAVAAESLGAASRQHRGIPPENLQSLIPDEDPSPDLQEDHVASRQHDQELVAPVSAKAHVRRLERNRDSAGIKRKFQSTQARHVGLTVHSSFLGPPCRGYVEMV